MSTKKTKPLQPNTPMRLIRGEESRARVKAREQEILVLQHSLGLPIDKQASIKDLAIDPHPQGEATARGWTGEVATVKGPDAASIRKGRQWTEHTKTGETKTKKVKETKGAKRKSK